MLSVVIPIQTSSCRLVWLKVGEVVFGLLLDFGWVTVGHTTFLPNHYKIIIRSSV